MYTHCWFCVYIYTIGFVYIYVHIHTHSKRFIIKKLAQITMESNKFPSHQGWVSKLETQKSYDVFLSKSEGLRTGRTSGAGPFPKAGSLKTQKELMFLFKYEGRKKTQCSSLKAVRQEKCFLEEVQIFCSIQAFSLLDNAHPHLEGRGGGRWQSTLLSWQI